MNWQPSLQYFAGLCDGEAYLGFRDLKRRTIPRIMLSMTDEKTVQAFADFFGIKAHRKLSPYHLNQVTTKGYKPQFYCQASCLKAYRILKQLQPYMLTRADIVAEIVSFYEDRKCLFCKSPIDIDKRGHGRYCTTKCQRKASRILGFQKHKSPSV